MAFAPLSFVRNVVAYFYYSVEEVRQDTVNLQLEIIELRKQIDRMEARLVHMQNQDRKRDFAVQHAIFREQTQKSTVHTHRLQLFETLAPEFECV
jgi:hypothetical protein